MLYFNNENQYIKIFGKKSSFTEKCTICLDTLKATEIKWCTGLHDKLGVRPIRFNSIPIPYSPMASDIRFTIFEQ